MNILHLVGSVGKKSFGLGPVALGLVSSQQALGHQVSIYSLDSEIEARALETAYCLRAGTIQTFFSVGPSRLAYSPSMERHLLACAAEYDVIHVHGVWTYISHIVNRWRARQGGPTIVAPHGSLNPWALRRSSWKKHLALCLYEHKNLNDASCLHALSKREAQGFRKFGLRDVVIALPIVDQRELRHIFSASDAGLWYAKTSITLFQALAAGVYLVLPKLPTVVPLCHDDRLAKCYATGTQREQLLSVLRETVDRRQELFADKQYRADYAAQHYSYAKVAQELVSY